MHRKPKTEAREHSAIGVGGSKRYSEEIIRVCKRNKPGRFPRAASKDAQWTRESSAAQEQTEEAGKGSSDLAVKTAH